MAWPARLDCDRRKPFSSRLLSWRKNQKITCFIVAIFHGMDEHIYLRFANYMTVRNKMKKYLKKGGRRMSRTNYSEPESIRAASCCPYMYS
ncbi:hypothetical protein E6D10_07855 [Escherichia coli]|nr:hypothetical protein [Escherichia coli]